MAEAAVGYVVKKLADALVKKAQELHAVRGQIEQMQKELRLIQAFLRDADSKRNKDELVKEWLNQVRDMAHRIEDVIDTFLAEIEKKRSVGSNKILRWLRNHYKMNKLSGELTKIIHELTVIYQRRTELRITVHGAGSQENDHLTFRQTETSIHVDDSEVVGFEADEHNIIGQLLDSSISRRTVLSIVGTGGLGKTTLAQKVYKSTKLEGHFDCRIWLSISQKFSLNDLLRKILYSIEPEMKNKNPPMTDEDVLVQLDSSLRHKRYLIILDDVWTIDPWEKLKRSIPDPNNMSRIIITSRFVDVALQADCNIKPYELRYLNDEESLTLLFRKAFQKHIEPENYPTNLLEVAKRLTKKCGGLPLALVVLGGILSRREPNYSAWNTKEDTMDWHDEDGEMCSKVLAMSYEDLPYELKPCFLYFASYPEDYKIPTEHVTRMWMDEGLIPKDRAGTIENKAEKCLEELVQRCLIRVTKKSWNGYYKYCNMHDLLRDMAITKAKEENFFTVFSNEGEDVNQLVARKPRRAALQFCNITKDGVYSKNTRSLLCFGLGINSSNDCGFGKLNYSGFRLLRVLTLESVNMTKFAQKRWSKGLIHLRYIGLRNCNIPHDLLKNFSFYNLETIDLKGSKIDRGETIDLCDVVIPTLRHVHGGENIYLPLKWDQHTNLQTVNVLIQRELVAEFGCCINLRILKIHFVGDIDNERAPQEWENLNGVLRRTEQLVNLSIQTWGNLLLPFGGTKNLPCHGNIQKLHLWGRWARDICVPSAEMFPPNLTKLTLHHSRIEQDLMPILEKLQSLRVLNLKFNSYLGTEMICSTGGFPRLEKLKLEVLPKLQHWDIKEGAMPILTHLKISLCWRLHTLPELQRLGRLQELLVTSASSKLLQYIQGMDPHKLEHIPSVCISERLKSVEELTEEVEI